MFEYKKKGEKGKTVRYEPVLELLEDRKVPDH